MATVINMPRYGATMEEGTVNSWFVKAGDHVSKGDVIAEIAIEKLTNELLAEVDGVVLKIVAEEGDTIACGQPILIIGAAGESLESAALSEPESSPKAAPVSPVMSAAAAAAPAATSVKYQENVQIAPKALELAKELGIDYHFVTGTGRFGMITREDIRNAVASGVLPKASSTSTPAAPASAVVKMSQMQLMLAKFMDQSLKTTAQTTISMDMDAAALVEAHSRHKGTYQQQGIKLSYTPILIKLIADALVEHPLLRTTIDETNLVIRGEIHIGFAVDIPDGLIVPVIKDANQKSISQIAKEVKDLAERARENKLLPDEISGGVFTITNLGMFGIKYFTPVLNPGEAGILGIGTIQDVPYSKDGGIFIKPVINMSLTHDHRVVSGAPAARFLQSIQQHLQNCEKYFTQG